MTYFRPFKGLALAGLAALLLQGCAVSQVKPWQKGILAEPEMITLGLGHHTGLNEHVFTSKEAGRGGGGVAGGGCGCN